MGNRQIIIHVDMDAFYASVEVRDDPSLAGKPLIIGSLPTEREGRIVMKKYLSLVLALMLMVPALAGCGGTTGN